MCTVCGAPTRTNAKAALAMLDDTLTWDGSTWSAVTHSMSVSDMHEYLRAGPLRNTPYLAAEVASGGTWTRLTADGDQRYTVVNSSNQSRMYREWS